MEGLQELTNVLERYHPRPPMASSSPRLGVCTPPKTSIAIISGRGKATHIHRIDRKKSPLKISATIAVSILRTPENFQGTHI